MHFELGSKLIVVEPLTITGLLPGKSSWTRDPADQHRNAASSWGSEPQIRWFWLIMVQSGAPVPEFVLRSEDEVRALTFHPQMDILYAG